MSIVRLSQLRSFTIAHDEVLPSARVHVSASGVFFWELRYFYFELKRIGLERKYFDWCDSWLKALNAVGLAGGNNVIRGSNIPDHLPFTAISTQAFLVLLEKMLLDKAHKAGGNHIYILILGTALRRLVGSFHRATLALSDPISVSHWHHSIRIFRGGCVAGWPAIISLCDGMLIGHWAMLRETGWLGMKITSHDISPTLNDVVLFLTWASGNLKARTAASRHLKQTLSSLLVACHVALAPYLDSYVHNIYGQTHDLHELPPLLRNVSRDGQRSRPLLMDAAGAWVVIERARAIHGMTAKTVLLVKNCELPLLHVCGSNADMWIRIECNVYEEKQMSIFNNAVHYNVVCDPSTYHGMETMIGVLWSWEKTAACVISPRYVPVAKHVLADDDTMTPEVVLRAREDTLTLNP